MSGHVTYDDLEKFAAVFGQTILGGTKKLVDASRAPLLKRIDQLEAETKELALKVKHFSYRGVHKSDVAYYAGNWVSAGGSMFVALRDSPKGTPGSSDDWQLAVKRGRDGDRARDRPYRIGSGHT